MDDTPGPENPDKRRLHRIQTRLSIPGIELQLGLSLEVESPAVALVGLLAVSLLLVLSDPLAPVPLIDVALVFGVLMQLHRYLQDRE